MNTKEIGKRIKGIRREAGLSQEDFGKKLFVSQNMVSLWENGRSVPTAEFLISIAEQFEVSVDYLLCLKEY